MATRIALWAAMVFSLASAPGQAPGASVASPTEGTLAPRARRPEPVIFAIMRRLQVTPVGQARTALRRLLGRFRGLRHDRAIKVGQTWLSGDDLKDRREKYTRIVAELAETIKDTLRDRPKNATEKARQSRLLAQAYQKLRTATAIWPDPLIRDFLFAQASLLSGNEAVAERRFTACIDRQRRIAGFYQGRAMALEALDRPVDALADRMRVFSLYPAEQTYLAIGETMKKVPGTRITSPVFLQARELLGRYEAPDRRRSSYQRGIEWFMPGGVWEGPPGLPPVPACDTFFARKTVAVPVSDNGVFLVDAAAVADAAEMLLEIGPDEYLRAEMARISSRAMKELQLPLAVVRVEGRSFTPVTMDPKAAVQVNDRLKLYAHSMPAELDTDVPRQSTVRVVAVEADGTITLDGALLPGESSSPLFDHAGRLVSFVAGRTDVNADDGGPGKVLKAAEVAGLYAEAVKSASGRSYSRFRRDAPKLKVPGGPVAGRIFTLHVILTQGGPEKRRR